MKKCLLSLALFLTATPMAVAQNFDNVQECQNLKAAVTLGSQNSQALHALLTDDEIDAEKYLEELYKAVQLLSQSGESFFRASDQYESDCETALKNAHHLDEMIHVYDLYLAPVKEAYQFFSRARAHAIRLGRQKDIETFTKAMREYEDSVLKIAAHCESTLTGTDQAVNCRALMSKLEDTLK